MLTGKLFCLKIETLGIEGTHGKRTAVQLSRNEIVRVVGGPTPQDERMVEVEWNSRRMVMFAEDIQKHAEEVHDGKGAHGGSA